MTNFQDVSDAIPAKHVLFVTDACYGGLALTRGGSQSYLQQITRRVARQMLTAGGADEQVADNGPNGHSIFTWTLMQGLEGKGDLNGDGFITASELAAYTGPIVSSLSRQTPAFGALAGSEGGEFVFQLSHETEFLSDASEQLEQEAITLNAELERLRASIAEKRARNEKLKSQVLSARAEAGGSAAAAPTSADANDRGMALFREKRYDEALAAFQEASAKAPGNALAANNVGFTYYKLARYQEAANWFDRTLTLDPSRAIAHANLGDAYFALEQPAKARGAYERYLQLQPSGKYAPTVRKRLMALGH
jgi:tetratricopeptide (TPR) repeat protein